MGQYKWSIFDDDRELSTLRKVISVFHWILVAKVSSRLFSYLLRKTFSHYGSSFSHYSTFVCGSVQNMIKKQIICLYKGKTLPTLNYFWMDQFLDCLPAVCPTDQNQLRSVSLWLPTSEGSLYTEAGRWCCGDVGVSSDGCAVTSVCPGHVLPGNSVSQAHCGI